MVDSESSAELDCAVLWLLGFSLTLLVLARCSDHRGTSRALSTSCSRLPLDFCVVAYEGPKTMGSVSHSNL